LAGIPWAVSLPSWPCSRKRRSSGSRGLADPVSPATVGYGPTGRMPKKDGKQREPDFDTGSLSFASFIFGGRSSLVTELVQTTICSVAVPLPGLPTPKVTGK
jgi:hypothetical protein